MSGQPEPNSLGAQNLQTKVELYAIGLTFTVLGLSIQTASFGRNLFADGLELLGWLALFFAGLVGLSRMVVMPHHMKVYGRRADVDSQLQTIRKVQHQSPLSPIVFLGDDVTLPVGEALDKTLANRKLIDEIIEENSSWQAGRYRAQKVLFVGGMALLLAGRAYLPAVRVILGLWRLTQ